jgi:hypothetical protein
MRACVIAILVCVASAAPAADDKPAVREVPLKDLKFKFPDKADVNSPAVITSADDLAKSPVLKDSADAIGKQVDFAKEKLVLFTWRGSGQDSVTPAADKKAAVFTYQRGLTRDLRQHVRLFAVPKDAGVKVVTAK